VKCILRHRGTVLTNMHFRRLLVEYHVCIQKTIQEAVPMDLRDTDSGVVESGTDDASDFGESRGGGGSMQPSD
jgi:hypothetical protein